MKKKIKLENLSVQSFVTALGPSEKQALKGGDLEVAVTKGNCESLVIPTQCCTGMYPSINYRCDTLTTG